LDYNDRGKPYHHKDLTIFGCDLSRVIMVDNSPIVCRGEEPNFILIKDYFGKDNMDDELMEVYQMLDAMIEIQGDVRYFLCGLESDQTEPIDTSTEQSCWELTEKLMNDLDAYYSEQIAFNEPQAGYVTEEEEPFMDDYDDEAIPDREKMFALSRPAPSPNTQQEEVPNSPETNVSTPPNGDKQTEQDIFDAMDDMNVDRSDDDEDQEPQPSKDSENRTKDSNNDEIPNSPSTQATRVTHSIGNSDAFSPKVTPAFAPGTPQLSVVSLPFSPNSISQTEQSTDTVKRLPLNNNASISQITITRVGDDGNETDYDYDEDEIPKPKRGKKRSVKFAAPSINTTAQQDPKLRFAQTPSRIGIDLSSYPQRLQPAASVELFSTSHAHRSGKSKSAKKGGGTSYTAGRYKKSQSARFKKGPLDGHLKRNKSLLLDPDKLGSLTKRHARYSSMSPRYAVWSFNQGHKGYKPKLSDLNVNDAIHSFGAVDTEDEDEEEVAHTKEHHQNFFSQRHNHQHTASSLTIDMRRSKNRTVSTKRVPTFKVDINPLMPSSSVDSKHSNGNDSNSNINININARELLSKNNSAANSTPPINERAGNYGKISPFQTKPSPDMSPDKLQQEQSISEISNLPQNAQTLTQQTTQDKDEFLDDDFIPPPSYTKRESLKTIDLIKAEKRAKKAKRMSEKRNSYSLKDRNNFNGRKVKKPKEFVITPIAGMTPIDQYMRDRRDQKNNGTHRRGYSSDAIEQIDFGSMDAMSMKSRPGQRKHKMSIQDDDKFGKVWRNTMAPRPSAKEILVQSKHDEFILLFQQQLAEVKKEKLETFQRKQSHVRSLEKRNSVPDFAMLSEIDSEADITAHRQRLSTLREEQVSNLTFSKTATLESVDERNKLDSSRSSKNGFKNGSKQKLLDDDGNSLSKVSIDAGLMDEWDKNVSKQHGCCYYFCCCCLCGIFMNDHESEDTDDGMTYSPHD